MRWLKRRQKPGQIGIGFHEAGATLAWLQPGSGQSGRVLRACDSIHGSDPARLAGPLRAWVETHKLTGADCVAVLEPGSYQVLQVEPPQVPDEELRTALRWRIRDLLSFPVEDAVLDLFPPPAAARERVRSVSVVVARKSLLQQRIGLIEAAGLKLRAIDIGQLAQRNVAASLPHDGKGLALLYLDDDHGLITLVRGGEIFLAREIDFGLDALPPEAPESGQDPAYERLTLELQRSLDYFESALSQAPLNRIVVFPGGDASSGLQGYLKQNFFQSQVHELNLDDLVETGADPESGAPLPACLHAVGAALRGAGATS